MVILLAGLVLFVIVVAAASVYVLQCGGPCERAAMIAYLMTVAASQLASVEFGSHWQRPEFAVMIVDTAYFAALLAIANRSTRFWPLWAAASQLVGTLTHLAPVLNPSIVKEIYATTQPFWGFPVLGAIVVGARTNQIEGRAS